MAVKANGNEVKAGAETVLFRHEKKFFNHPGLFLRVYDDESAEAIKTKISLPMNSWSITLVLN